MSDEKLLSKLNEGCEKSFECIYKKYWERIFNFIHRMTSDKDLSQVITQDVFVSLWENRKSANISNLSAYLFQAAKFQVFKYYRDNKLNREILETEFDLFIEENTDDINDKLIEQLNFSINQLPEKRRQILLMNKVDNLNSEEISRQLNISNQTVRNQLSSAIKQVRHMLNEATYLFLSLVYFLF
ncbi:RNA polymerase sigma factor [Marinifilum sp.]|uniref:RNA polymerase sigma factor n=1 Tax=Marinifilum sp. TaxID=2033137 RepID=UPI003BACE56D